MANGFALGGFGEGLTSGFSAGSQAFGRNRALALQERQIEQADAKAQREQLQAGLDVTNQTLDEFKKVISEAAKNVGPQRAQQFLDDPRFQAQITQAVEVRNTFMQQLGIGGAIKPDDVIAALKREAQAQPSAADKGIRAGEEQVAEADVISGAVGGLAEERQRNFVNLLGISEGSQGEFLNLLSTLAQTPPGPARDAIQGRINRLSQVEGGGFVLEVTPDGGVRVSQGVGQDQIPTVAGGRLDELRAQQSTVTTGLEIVGSLLNQVEVNPEIFGATGTVRGAEQTLRGIASDALRATPGFESVEQTFEALGELIDAEDASQEVKSALRPASVGEIATFQGILKYTVARALQPEGRLLKDAVDQAANLTNLTGLTSSRQVRERLETIQQILRSRQTDIQRRQGQGVTGVSDIERAPAVREPVVQEPTTRRLRFDAEGNPIP